MVQKWIIERYKHITYFDEDEDITGDVDVNTTQ